jgi:hypothetical protein
VVQAEQFGHRRAHLRGVRAERGRGAACAEQRHERDPRCGLRETLALPGELRQQGAQRGTERGGDGLLGVGAGGHHGFRVLGDPSGEGVTQPAQGPVEGGQRARHLQREPGVHDVLGGRAVVDAAVGTGREPGADRADEAEDRVADGAGGPPEGLVVDVVQPGCPDDRHGVVAGDHAVLGLGERQCPFRGEPALDRALLGEDRQLLLVGREVHEQREGGPTSGRGHRRTSMALHGGAPFACVEWIPLWNPFHVTSTPTRRGRSVAQVGVAGQAQGAARSVALRCRHRSPARCARPVTGSG